MFIIKHQHTAHLRIKCFHQNSVPWNIKDIKSLTLKEYHITKYIICRIFKLNLFIL